jgi:hypothetical protein
LLFEWVNSCRYVADGYIVGLADHCLPVTASTFPQLAHRGFGVAGRPQMLDRDWDGFKLQGGGEPWSNKHLPLCEVGRGTS